MASGAYNTLFVGDPAPWFRQRCIGQDGLFSFDMIAGRFVVLCFYGSASDDDAVAALSLIKAHRTMFDGINLSFFGISNDAADEADTALAPAPGVRHFMDSDSLVSRAYGVVPGEGTCDTAAVRKFWFVLDPRLRVVAVFPLDESGNQAIARFLQAMPTVSAYFGPKAQTPVLIVPHVFEPEFCIRLIKLYQAAGAADSRMLTEDASIVDRSFKRRRDWRITDDALVAQIQTRIFRRVVPEIRHAFQFIATRLERLIVACYDAAEDGRFGAHRDNTLTSTAHRRFAVSINLNEDFEGGDIGFPEYGPRLFRPPPGGALVFSCSLMHAVVPVTRGQRYACLPFVYDDAAAELRRRHSRADE